MKLWCVLAGLLLCASLLAAVEPDSEGAASAPDAVGSDVTVSSGAGVAPCSKAPKAAKKAETQPPYQLYPNAVGFGGFYPFEGRLAYQRWFANGFGFEVIAGSSIQRRKSGGDLKSILETKQ